MTKKDFYSASADGYDELYGKEQEDKLKFISELLSPVFIKPVHFRSVSIDIAS